MKTAVVFLLGLVTFSVFAATPLAPEDFTAPTFAGTASMGSRPTGLIFFDSTDNSFKGINQAGNPVNFSYGTGSAVYSSGASEAIERARIEITGSACNVTSRSGNWVALTGTRTSTGTCELSISGFSGSAPTCTCASTQPNSSGSKGFCLQPTDHTQSATAITIQLMQQVSSNPVQNIDYVDTTANIICMGAR